MFAISGDVLRMVTKAVRQVSNEARLKMSDKGVIIQAVDPAVVELLVVKMPANSFSAYNSELNGEIGLDFGELEEILSAVTADIDVCFTRDKNTGQLLISYGTTEYTLPLLSLSEVRVLPRTQEMSFDVTVSLDMNQFTTAIKSVKNITSTGDDVTIMTAGKELSVLHSGRDKKVKTSLKYDDDMVEAVARFSIEYIDGVVASLRKCEDVVMSLSMSYPVRFDGNYEGVDLIWIVAPRLEES